MIIGPVNFNKFVNEYSVFNPMIECNIFLDEIRHDNYILFESADNIISKFTQKLKEMITKFKNFIIKLFDKFKALFSKKSKEIKEKVDKNSDKFKYLLNNFNGEFEITGIEYTLDNDLPNDVSIHNYFETFKLDLDKSDIQSKESLVNRVEKSKIRIDKESGKIRGKILGFNFIDIEDDLNKYIDKVFIKNGVNKKYTMKVNKDALSKSIERIKKGNTATADNLIEEKNRIIDSFKLMESLLYNKDIRTIFPLLYPRFSGGVNGEEKTKAIEDLATKTDYLWYISRRIEVICSDVTSALSSKYCYIASQATQDDIIISKALEYMEDKN